MQVLFTLGALPLMAPAWLRARRAALFRSAGAAVGILTGLVAAVANLAYFSALRHGQASIVAPTVALYPVVTFALAMWLLKERLNRFQFAGVVLAIGAIILLSF
jgi:uncharacterized membrane protein